MTLEEAITLLLDTYHIEDHIYNIRDAAREDPSIWQEWTGSSWDHPFVQQFEEVIETLKTWKSPS
jgi:hypothetical protein